MILGIKTKKDKKIDQNEKIIKTLIEESKNKSKEIENLEFKNTQQQVTIDELNKEINDRNKEIKKQKIDYISLIDKLTTELNECEKRRKTNAGKCGGLTKENNKLKFDNEDLKKLLKKKELDYYFALRVLFREIKMTQDTRVFLKQKLIDLKKKGYDKDAVSIPK